MVTQTEKDCNIRFPYNFFLFLCKKSELNSLARLFFMQAQKLHLTNYPNEYNLRVELFKRIKICGRKGVMQMRRCEVCFAPLPEWAEAYLWPCAHGGLTVCADCFDALVSGLSRRELAQRLCAEVQP